MLVAMTGTTTRNQIIWRFATFCLVVKMMQFQFSEQRSWVAAAFAETVSAFQDSLTCGCRYFRFELPGLTKTAWNFMLAHMLLQLKKIEPMPN
jgi:hypothetical protein